MAADDVAAEQEEQRRGPFQALRRLLPWGGGQEDSTEFGRMRKAMAPVARRPIPDAAMAVREGEGQETDMDLLSGRHNPKAAGFLLSRRRLLYDHKWGLTYDVWTDDPMGHVMSLPSQSLSLQKLAATVWPAVEGLGKTQPNGPV